eukprot:m.690894 g.690894  ORF g.690894 m.690894 type:complete len:186 (-) comp22852_c0_seq30:2315-2872(-)
MKVAQGDDQKMSKPENKDEHCPDQYDVHALKTQLQEDGTLVLCAQTNSEGVLEKFAVSDGIVESIKLGILERSMQESLSRSTDVSTVLRQQGKLLMSRDAVLRWMAELFIMRIKANELMDGDWYWDQPNLEEIYTSITSLLDVGSRLRALNKNLDNVTVCVLFSRVWTWFKVIKPSTPSAMLEIP